MHSWVFRGVYVGFSPLQEAENWAFPINPLIQEHFRESFQNNINLWAVVIYKN